MSAFFRRGQEIDIDRGVEALRVERCGRGGDPSAARVSAEELETSSTEAEVLDQCIQVGW